MRGAMMLTSSDFGTWLTWPSSSSPICGTAIDFALVEGRGDGAAKQRLHPLGMGQRGRQPAGDVVGHMDAADRHRIGEDQIAAEKHPDRRRAAAHVDDRDAEIHLVFDEAGEARGIGADDQRLDFEMRASDRGGVVAHARRRRR